MFRIDQIEFNKKREIEQAKFEHNKKIVIDKLVLNKNKFDV